MIETYSFIYGFGWGLGVAMTGCWFLGLRHLKHDHEKLNHDVTDEVGDQAMEKALSKPDGNAVVLEDMTEKQAEEFKEMELRGWKKLYAKLKKLI